jgi:phosphoribosyl 1,2-cyclic phosphodiesterase
MKITFCGVRGSIPSPGKEFIKYGGNTACIHIDVDDKDIILDSGTGIRALGARLIKKTTPIHLLLSHNHWDHIQGFPFFAPIFQSQREINIYPGLTELEEPEAILNQMTGSLFPVHRDMLTAEIRVHNLASSITEWEIGSVHIKRLRMNHPGGGSSYRIEANGKALVYITDNELYPPYTKATDFLDFVNFAKNADLLVHDAQYLVTDMPAKSGWGHSVAEEAVKLAMACNAKQLALYSHDPTRTDTDIDEIIEHSQLITELGGAELTCFAAEENQVLVLA